MKRGLVLLLIVPALLIVAAGAAVVTAPYAVPWGQTVAYVRSVEGTIIGLCTPLPAAASTGTPPVPADGDDQPR